MSSLERLGKALAKSHDSCEDKNPELIRPIIRVAEASTRRVDASSGHVNLLDFMRVPFSR